MSFVVTTPATPEVEPPINPGPFWPEVDPAAIRAAQRIDGTVTAERLNAELIEAIASVNGELAAWRETQQAAGYDTLAEIPAAEINAASINVHRYLRAVGCLAKAGLTERHPDFDATGKGERKAGALDGTIDDLRRDARWAIADILGVRRTTVELI
jgi:hypothetical protein